MFLNEQIDNFDQSCVRVVQVLIVFRVASPLTFPETQKLVYFLELVYFLVNFSKFASEVDPQYTKHRVGNQKHTRKRKICQGAERHPQPVIIHYLLELLVLIKSILTSVGTGLRSKSISISIGSD